MDQDGIGVAHLGQIVVVPGQRLEPGIRGFHEDVRVEAGLEERAPDAKNLVSNRVAVTQRGEHLMHGGLNGHGLSSGDGVFPRDGRPAGGDGAA